MEILLSGIAGLALGFGLTYAYQYKKLKDQNYFPFGEIFYYFYLVLLTYQSGKEIFS